MRKTVVNRPAGDRIADFLNLLRFVRERVWIVAALTFLSGSATYIAIK
ncbi:MAG: hypothetical protein ACI4LP_03845 [Anaerovoracaceae bacterium]